MALKIGISLLDFAMKQNCNALVDIVFNLAYMSTEYTFKPTNKDNAATDKDADLFIIHAEKGTRNFLAQKLSNQIQNITLRTANTLLQTLIDNNMIRYDFERRGWILINMENDFKKNGRGFIRLRKIFFSSQFSKLKKLEKKLLIFMCILKDSKASRFYNNCRIEINLLKQIWFTALDLDYNSSSSHYYLTKKIHKILNKSIKDKENYYNKEIPITNT